jgi:integrase
MYLEKHAKVRKKSWKNDRNQIKCYLSDWGKKKLSEIERKDVVNLHFKVGKESGHYAANRVIALLRKIFNLAESWDLSKTGNPATKIEFFRESKRDRFVRPDELPRLMEALKQEPNFYIRGAFFTMLMTGQRKMEVLSMAWADVDLNQGIWRIPETKTGEPHYVPLPEPVRELLKNIPMTHENPFIFCGRGKNHLMNIEKSWKKICKRAELPGLRIHDLRRTTGSWLAGAGASLPLIGRVLHHTQPSTTAIYARFDLAPIRAALESNAQRMLLIGEKIQEGQNEENKI